MHIIVREARELDEAAVVQDLGLSPADILVLSFSDSDLAMAAAAFRNVPEAERPSLRVANLSALRHPPGSERPCCDLRFGSECPRKLPRRCREPVASSPRRWRVPVASPLRNCRVGGAKLRQSWRKPAASAQKAVLHCQAA